MEPSRIEDWIDAAATLLALPDAQADRAAVAEHFARLAAVAAVLDTFPLDAEVEPLPVFRR